jgi:hypothetical protein
MLGTVCGRFFYGEFSAELRFGIFVDAFATELMLGAVCGRFLYGVKLRYCLQALLLQI